LESSSWYVTSVPTHQRANRFPQRTASDAIWTVDIERRVSELVQARVTEVTGRAAEAFRLVLNAGKPEAGILEAAEAWNVDYHARTARRGDRQGGRRARARASRHRYARADGPVAPGAGERRRTRRRNRELFCLGGEGGRILAIIQGAFLVRLRRAAAE
jgi:hypothetical protein